MMPETTATMRELKRDLQFILRRANELQSDFEICDDINMAVISALKTVGKIETVARSVDGEAVAA